MTQHAQARDARRPVMVASLLVSFLMLGGKLTAYFITGSTAILSDALESVIHLLATGFAAFSLWYAVQPADPDHPYGHGKVAYFSSGFEGALIMVAAGGIIYAAVRDLISGPELTQIGVGIWITAGLAAVNLVLGLALVRAGKKHNSLVLTSNGHHVLTDMWTSIGVVAALLLVQWTDALWLDPVVAIAVALNILWTSWSLMKRSISGLMEAADPGETEAIRGILDAAVDDRMIVGYHELRHRRVYDRLWIEYHLIFTDETSLQTSHDISHRIEDDLDHLFRKDEVIITAHLEPESHEPQFATRRDEHERSPLPSREVGP